MENIFAARIEALRSLMSENGWEAVVLSGSDPHSSEYPAPRWQQVKWLTGFTGEAGDVVVTMNHAGLWTDSRYFIQAVSQLEGTGVELHKTRMPDSVYIPQWLAEQGITKVAVDGLCWNVDAVEEIRNAISSDSVQASVTDVPDLLESLWTGRPQIPVTPIVTLDVECFGGVPRADKICWLRKWMMLHDIDRVLLTSLDEIAWMLNVRGNDIEYNPLVISYLLVSQDYVRWFVRKPESGEDPDTVDSFSELEMDGVEIEDYDAVFFGLSDFTTDTVQPKLFVDPSSLNHHLYTYITDSYPADCVVMGKSPVILQKAVKVESEIENLRQTYVDDGLAVTRFIHWLETEVASGREVTEWEASERLTAFRAEIPGYRGNSFENISAYGPSAALPHYSTPCEGSAVIHQRGLYLSDSGGQYLTGTTDITRTVPMGECTDLEKEDYTLVLKGMIGLSMAVFPKGTAGCQLDVLARMPLWKARRNYGHGTGHGIGYWLCVHEGPQDIRQNFNSQPQLPGMVTSNEPALYRQGMHGIRHENVILCKSAGQSDFGDWLEFETLTCCHFDTSAVVRDLLDAEELRWLNAYNERVYRTLSPLLDPETSAWLRYKTIPI
ncbi:MAG: aminopeptidase P family protein [Bacteroidales bacterium]|nr:aminopeptidase P family protein [Bacteroidales bacterium]